MPVLMILLLAGVLSYLYWRRRTTSLTRDCRWRADRLRDGEEGHFYRCAACGAEIRVTRDAPRVCLREDPAGSK
ncbi:hypothetical protein AB1M95_16895 [Sulfitobacter sp. LCG007]